MTKLSVCMIVKNEGAVLEKCLRDASFFADELIVVDTGSTDATKEIAVRYTDKVYDFEWCDDFAAARNASYSHATCDHIMWLDADDCIDEENIAKILKWKQLVTEEPMNKGMIFLAGYERPENGGIFLYPRIVRRDAGFRWEGIVHEHLVYRGNTGTFTAKDEKGSKKDNRGGEQNAGWRDLCMEADFFIRHAKRGEPDYRRNIALMEKIPEEELHCSFWLCAQCYIDCVLAGEDQKAKRYLAMAEDSATPFAERLETYALIGRVLKFRKNYDAMLKWNAMYLRCKEKLRSGRL